MWLQIADGMNWLCTYDVCEKLLTAWEKDIALYDEEWMQDEDETVMVAWQWWEENISLKVKLGAVQLGQQYTWFWFEI